MNNEHESTYTLLVRSEEKGRDVLETAVYVMCILSAVIAIWQFMAQSSQILWVALHRGHIPLFISRSAPLNRMRIRNLEKNKLSSMPGSLTLKRERGATPKRDYKIPQTRKHR